MADDDIRRSSLDKIKRMRAGGLTRATPVDAPEIELDEEFWRNAGLPAYRFPDPNGQAQPNGAPAAYALSERAEVDKIPLITLGYGLAASQLQRLREKQIPLTVAVDKVAASGGYMMACVADKIVAAPFSIIGSIGVVAQIPNFNRFLKNKEIDIELHTAGQYKRTLTLLGENTEEGRQKFREDLNETHHLFKDFVHRMRPTLDIEQVATGEHWYGVQAQEKGLVDEVGTSDDLLLNLMDGRELIGVRFTQRKRLMDRFTNSAAESADRLLLRWLQRGQKPLL